MWSSVLCSEPDGEVNIIAVQEEWATATDKELTADTTVSLKGIGLYSAKIRVRALSASYEMFLEACRSCNKVPRYFVQFFNMMSNIDLYTRCVREGAAVTVDLLFLKWGVIFAAAGKHKYVKLMARWCKEGYGKKMTPTQIEEFWRNRFVRLTLLHGMIAKEVMCEKLNLWIKSMPNPGDNRASL